jgi:hypothetical protein
MRKFRVLALAGIGLLIAIGLGVAAEGDADSGLEFTKMSSLSAAEQLTQGRAFLDGMKDSLARVSKLADEARKDKDVIRLNCINEKLVAVRGLLSIAETSFTALEDAVEKDDTEERNHEFTKISIASTKVNELKTEAELCAGEVTIYSGDTVVDTTVDPSVPEDDPTVEDDPGPEIVRPTETSPAS